MSDKFTYDGDGDFVLSQCAYCKHLTPGTEPVCAAFPVRIPDEFLHNDADHRRPWIDPDTGRPGDGGIGFEPRDGITPFALDGLFRHLEATGVT